MNLEKLEKLASLAEKYDYKPDEGHFNNLAAFVGINSSLIADLSKEYTTLQREITNAQEALKSAGIEADTVQAGVMELKAQGDALAAENAEQVSSLKALATLNNRLWQWTSRMSYNASYVGEPEGLIKGHIREMEEILDAAPKETPATDAYLNAVRAEGADAAAAKIRKAIPAFKDIHCGAVKECADIAEMVAAQFTTGNAGKDGRNE